MSGPPRLDPQHWKLGNLERKVAGRLRTWGAERVSERLWKFDPTLWASAPPAEVGEREGWLELPRRMRAQVGELTGFADEVRKEGTRHVVLLGMGGSSLAPEVLSRVFGPRSGYPELSVLDSTHPAAVATLAESLDLRQTFCLVSSKSGTTTEPLAFYRYFWDAIRTQGIRPGRQFAAITDPGTPLEALAKEQGFRRVFRALPTVGGRYSALSAFGLVPAAMIGLDISRILEEATAMVDASAPSVPAADSPGLALGAALGEAAVAGRDKLTFLSARSLRALPTWLEQLVAESTGKRGRGIVPVVDEPRAPADRYGTDRFFVEFQPTGDRDAELRTLTERLEKAGHPVVRIELARPEAIGQEFFRWELAIAASAVVLGIDPFDQPDVEAAKEAARQEMAHPSTGGGDAPPTVSAGDPGELARSVRAWLSGAVPGDYVAIQAYLAPRSATADAIERLRRALFEKRRIATTAGYGPRFLHSTGQLHKGGPSSGLFLQIVDAPVEDVEVPGAGYTFGTLIRAQAIGDYRAMREKGRRVLRVDLGRDVPGGLRRLLEAGGS